MTLEHFIGRLSTLGVTDDVLVSAVRAAGAGDGGALVQALLDAGVPEDVIAAALAEDVADAGASDASPVDAAGGGAGGGGGGPDAGPTSEGPPSTDAGAPATSTSTRPDGVWGRHVVAADQILARHAPGFGPAKRIIDRHMPGTVAGREILARHAFTTGRRK